MNKVYVISFKDEYENGEYESGVSYVFDTLEKAKDMLEIIKKDELAKHKKNGIKNTSTKIVNTGLMTSLIIENNMVHTEFNIEEMTIRR